ncbi:MAG TPA: hypothetical protein VFO54_06705 [Chryseosolibacter sp.]|nr:hypothetical protein [Chryseosolibacter sp.]
MQEDFKDLIFSKMMQYKSWSFLRLILLAAANKIFVPAVKHSCSGLVALREIG